MKADFQPVKACVLNGFLNVKLEYTVNQKHNFSLQNKLMNNFKAVTLCLLVCLTFVPHGFGHQRIAIKDKGRPLVNQAGYNLGEAKRFVCPGAADGLKFTIQRFDKVKPAASSEVLYTGTINNHAGEFTNFNPVSNADEYVINVEGFGDSDPFLIGDHLTERISSRLAYQFFIDVRGSADELKWNEAKVAGGGPSRDGGAYTLETLYETLFYASNPALFDRWTNELKHKTAPDLIALILYHARFAYDHIDYNGPTGSRPYMVGHRGQKLQTYDYQNTLDQLAAVLAGYHKFLKPHLDDATYQKYRQACLDNWEKYERHKEVRYWIKSDKWIDVGWTEFNEMGNAFGQGLFRNMDRSGSERRNETSAHHRYRNRS